MVQTRSQTKTNSTVWSRVHGIDKGVDLNLRPEKQVIKPQSGPVQSHVPTVSKCHFHAKPRI